MNLLIPDTSAKRLGSSKQHFLFSSAHRNPSMRTGTGDTVAFHRVSYAHSSQNHPAENLPSSRSQNNASNCVSSPSVRSSANIHVFLESFYLHLDRRPLCRCKRDGISTIPAKRLGSSKQQCIPGQTCDFLY